MTDLLKTDPYVTAGDSDTHNAGDTAVKFDLGYIVGEQDDWCQTTEAARMKSREPVIDHAIDYADTAQEDQMQHAADELVNQQRFMQFATQCQKCEKLYTFDKAFISKAKKLTSCLLGLP